MNVGDSVIAQESVHGLNIGEEYLVTASDASFVTVVDRDGNVYGDGKDLAGMSGDGAYIPCIAKHRFRPYDEEASMSTGRDLASMTIAPDYDKALDILIDFNEFHSNDVDAAGNDEYLRGQVELLSDLFGQTDVRRDIQRKLDDRHEDALADERAIAGGKVVDALTELYVLVDSDEAMVGEMMYEIDKAARRNAQEV